MINRDLIISDIVKQLQEITGHKVECEVHPFRSAYTFRIHGTPDVSVDIPVRELGTTPTNLILSNIIRDARNAGMKPNLVRERETDPDLEKRFTYHSPKPGQTEKYQKIRDMAKELAYAIKEEAGVSRESSSALSSLELAVFWTNAAIARNG